MSAAFDHDALLRDVGQLLGAGGGDDQAEGEPVRLRPSTSPRPRPRVTSPLAPPPKGRGEVDHLAHDLAHDVDSWVPRSLSAIAASAPEPPSILELFYPGLFHVVSGESEAMKTWLLMVAAVEEVHAGRGVLWIDADDVGPGAVGERLAALGADGAAADQWFGYVRPDGPLTAAACAGLVAFVAATSCRLAVVDGFNPALTLHGLNANDGGDVERLYALLDPVRKAGAAVVLTDNVAKDRESRGAWAIGSERKKSKADVCLGMSRIEALVRGGTGRARIDVHKDRPGHLERPSPGVLVLESDGERLAWSLRGDESRGEAGEFRPTGLMERVSRLLEQSGVPLTMNAIETAKLGRREYVRQAVDVLVLEGYAARFSGARGAKLIRSDRPFREDEAGAE